MASTSKTVKSKSSVKAFAEKVPKVNEVLDLDDDEDDFKPSKRNSITTKTPSKNSSSSSKAETKMKRCSVLLSPIKSINGNNVDFKPRSSLPNPSTVEDKKDISSDLENVDDVEILFSTSPPPFGTGDAEVKDNNNGKTAWKSLMEQMQNNQKKVVTTGRVSKAKGKATFKRGLVQSPQKGLLEKPVQSPIKKVPRLRLDSSTSENELKSEHQTNSDQTPVSKVEQAKEDNNATPTTSASSITSPPKTEIKSKSNIAPIFLRPAEKKKLQDSKTDLSSNENSDVKQLLESIIKSSEFTSDTEEEKVRDNPNHFDGNTVLLNLDQPTGDPYEGNKTKTCPFYKKLPGVPFCVDAFNYGLIPGMEVYFLSHFHSDHYIGLSKKFCKTIICSRPTGNLVRMKLYVEEKCIRKLRMNKPYVICGSEVTLINANHCPGSVMFVFRLKSGQTILHTGDFRYTPEMLRHPSLQKLRLDLLYLDTTYCNPKYDFPTQWNAVSTVVNQVKRHLDFRPKTLVLCGSYLIGKERVYMTLAEAIGTKVFAVTDKRKIINALENTKFSNLLTEDETAALVHVVPMFSINPKNLHEYLEKRPQFTNIIGIKPSGWQFSSCGSGCSVKSHYGDTVTVIGIPYSEHSSYSELKEFVSSLKPKRVQPTVNVGNAKKRGEMMQHIENWLLS